MARANGEAFFVLRYVGPIVQETLHECNCQLETNTALCEAVQDSGKCDDYEGMVKNPEAFKTDHTKQLRISSGRYKPVKRN